MLFTYRQDELGNDELAILLRDILARVKAIEEDRVTLRADIAAFLSRMVTISQAQDVKIGQVREMAQGMIIQARRQEPPRTGTGPLADAEKRTGRLIDKHFNKAELFDLCLDFGIEFENLEGETVGVKARELAGHMARRGRLGELVKRCVELRPKAYGWPIEVINEY